MEYNKHALLDGLDLFLHSWSGDGERFIRDFRETWERIPSAARANILGLWSDCAPLIELSDLWNPAAAYGQVKSSILASRVVQIAVKFRASAFSCFPRLAAQWVIAHEMAHVYEKARGQLPDASREAETEDRVNLIAEQWGFRVDCLNLIDLVQKTRKLSIFDACDVARRLPQFADGR